MSNFERPAADQEFGQEHQCNDTHEPLGYQSYLYDVNIEYSPGGGRWDYGSSQHSFKLKCLPYMVSSNSIGSNKRSDENIDSFLTDSNASSYSLGVGDEFHSPKIDLLDVSKTTCAFLGNSDYVPNINRPESRRVVLELISAKLSQSTTYLLPSKQSPTASSRSTDRSHDDSPADTTNPIISSRPVDVQTNTDPHNSNVNKTSHIDPSPPYRSSKRFVNYTLLIKTAPGLDTRPAVIERRFSDFLSLYQRLKMDRESFAKILDRNVAFPKKVFMGNFSLNNIADRSVEFLRLLKLCMTREDFLWSVPFISFLLDKELKEAHKLVTCGDPDDVQNLVETVYFILQKLYLHVMAPLSHTTSSPYDDSSSPEVIRRDMVSQLVYPHRRPNPVHKSSSEETMSGDPASPSTLPDSSPSLSVSEDSTSLSPIKCIGGAGGGGSIVALNQRILVTFCMLFLTYSRGENFHKLKLAFGDFSQLLSSAEYMNSIAITRHQSTLKACLLFLMNINQSEVIDDAQRLWLKRKLEDFDGFVASLNGDNYSSNNVSETNNGNTPNGISGISSQRFRRANGSTNGIDCNRVIKGDLISVLKDKNFCLFHDSTRSL